MKKKVLFVHEQMNIGGVESALLAALNLLDPEKYDLHLMLFKLGGPLFDTIPKYVTVHKIPFKPVCQYRFNHGYVRGLLHAFLTGHWIYAIRLAWAKLVWIIVYRAKTPGFHYVESEVNARMVDKQLLPKNINIAIAFTGGIPVGCCVAENFKGSRKAIWFHNGGLVKYIEAYKQLLVKFDDVFCCSKDVTAFYQNVFGSQFHVKTIPHITESDRYLFNAQNGVSYQDDFSRLRILSVGRLSPAKGIEDAVAVASRLKSEGLKFRWYWVGGASEGDADSYLNLPVKYDIEDSFVFLGPTTNPFAYYRDCDIYVQPSRWEAYCLTVAEARAFNKPIIVTDFVGAREQIKDGETGIIVPVGNLDQLTVALQCLIEKAEYRERLSQNLANVATDEISSAIRAWEEFLDD